MPTTCEDDTKSNNVCTSSGEYFVCRDGMELQSALISGLLVSHREAHDEHEWLFLLHSNASISCDLQDPSVSPRQVVYHPKPGEADELMKSFSEDSAWLGTMKSNDLELVNKQGLRVATAMCGFDRGEPRSINVLVGTVVGGVLCGLVYGPIVDIDAGCVRGRCQPMADATITGYRGVGADGMVQMLVFVRGDVTPEPAGASIRVRAATYVKGSHDVWRHHHVLNGIHLYQQVHQGRMPPAFGRRVSYQSSVAGKWSMLARVVDSTGAVVLDFRTAEDFMSTSDVDDHSDTDKISSTDTGASHAVCGTSHLCNVYLILVQSKASVAHATPSDAEDVGMWTLLYYGRARHGVSAHVTNAGDHEYVQDWESLMSDPDHGVVTRKP